MGFVSALVGELVWTCLREATGPVRVSPIIVAMGVLDQPVLHSSLSPDRCSGRACYVTECSGEDLASTCLHV
ncbi:hypothetical protein BDA96_09G258900 [Sorghum bicolor]|uniref:Uncharacterized protein n=2 Tax=Sorghum bicolor TaxID=4558 RepID=A0A921QBU1_SORBI|nr:hypothetical protein BDA96_09G258900 [Sorghum bicolor]OQU78491.1 hypothetical protein SORBI_3009G244650 [Sorghum bicolor]